MTRRPGLFALLLGALPLQAATLEVSVRRADGSAAAGASVCVGTAADPVQFARKTTDTQGRASFPSVPPTPFVVTASLGGRGVRQERTGPPALGGVSPSLAIVQVTLPAGQGGPVCAPGPDLGSRPLLPPGTITELPTVRPIRTIGPIDPRREFCFGALGNQCGQPQPPMPQTALCSGGFCFINGGSWDHDECCFANPRGMACQKGPLDAVTGHDGNCVTSWDKALRLASKGLFWKRPVDFSRNNTTGRVEFNVYCAPRGSLLPPEDGRRCCSQRTRALTTTEAAAALAAGERLVACE